MPVTTKIMEIQQLQKLMNITAYLMTVMTTMKTDMIVKTGQDRMTEEIKKVKKGLRKNLRRISLLFKSK